MPENNSVRGVRRTTISAMKAADAIARCSPSLDHVDQAGPRLTPMEFHLEAPFAGVFLVDERGRRRYQGLCSLLPRFVETIRQQADVAISRS